MPRDQGVWPRNLKFFRVLLPGFASKLPLPSAFINHFIQQKSRWVTLLSPLGKAWHVRVHEDDRFMNFADGWQEFAADHQLRMGDFLVFKHKGGHIFDVTIFDQSTCERNYDPIGTTTNGFSEDRLPREENNISSRKVGRPRKVTGGSIRHTSCVFEPDTKKRQLPMVRKCTVQSQDRMSATTNGQERRPHQFEVVMKKHHYRTYLEIPRSFRASSVLSGISRLVLRDPKGQLWPMRLCHGKNRSHTRSMIYLGWQAFCAANNVKEGDACVFVLVGKDKLRVQIRRGRGMESNMENALLKDDSAGGHHGSLPGQKTMELVKDQKASKSIGTCSSPGIQFKSTIFSSSLCRDYLNIPEAFLAAIDWSSLRRVVLVDSKFRQWPVKVDHWRVGANDHVKLCCGWRAFCSKNNVEVGDVCVFKLATSDRNDVFHVQVARSPTSIGSLVKHD